MEMEIKKSRSGRNASSPTISIGQRKCEDPHHHASSSVEAVDESQSSTSSISALLCTFTSIAISFPSIHFCQDQAVFLEVACPLHQPFLSVFVRAACPLCQSFFSQHQCTVVTLHSSSDRAVPLCPSFPYIQRPSHRVRRHRRTPLPVVCLCATTFNPEIHSRSFGSTWSTSVQSTRAQELTC